MRSRLVLSTLLLLTLLAPAAGAGTAPTTDASVPGIYLYVEVNGNRLPSVVWTKTSENRQCEIEDLRGALLLDSEGRWFAVGTEREICTDQNGSRTVSEERSSVLVGSYEASGGLITFHDETLGGSFEGSLTEGVLFVKDSGIGDYEGQTSEWVFHKAN